MGQKRVQIVTDSTADLTPDMVRELGVTVVPLNVTLEGETFKDGSMAPEEFLAAMKQARELPQTSQPSPGDFLEVFTDLVQHGPVLCITMSSKLSGTLQSAQVAAGMVENVTAFDSLSATLAEGAQVMRAVEMAEAGRDVDEIVGDLTQYRDKHRVFIAVSDLTNLVKGGRLSLWQGRLADFMRIKPVLHNKEGAIELLEKVRGLDQVFERAIELIAEQADNIQDRVVAVSHAGNPERAEWAVEQLRKLNPKDVIVGPMGCVISTHAGPGAVIMGA